MTGIDLDARYVRLAALNLREQGLDGELVHGGDRRFLLRYGAPFWTVLARRR